MLSSHSSWSMLVSKLTVNLRLIVVNKYHFPKLSWFLIRFLYWISRNGTYKVYKASMDEKDITELYNTDQYIKELHLDHSAQVLYWAISREIWSMGVDGSNPIVLLQLPIYIHSFAQWNNLVYWTDYSGIHSITKDGSSNTTLVESLDATCYYYQRTRYNAIAIISGNKQQPGTPDLELSPTSTRLHSHVQGTSILFLRRS